MNEQHPFKHVIVDEYSALAKSTDVKNLPVDELKISMETTGGDTSWINGKNEINNRSIHNMVRAALLDINHRVTNSNEKNMNLDLGFCILFYTKKKKLLYVRQLCSE